MEKIRIARLSDLRKGDIIILRHKMPVNAALKEEDGKQRKYKVLSVNKDYALCESLNGYPHKALPDAGKEGENIQIAATPGGRGYRWK